MKTKKEAFHRPHHLLAKAVCLLLAVVFWLYVMYVAAPPYDATYTDISVKVIESEVLGYTAEVLGPIPSVRVVGPKMALAACDSEDIVATVSLSDLLGTKDPLYDQKQVSLKVSFTTPDGITVEGEYTVLVILSQVES